jgi:glutamate--cysteine ligase
MSDREALRNDVPRLGLDAPLPGGGKLIDVAGEVLAIAASGLRYRAELSGSGESEVGFLEPLQETVRTGKTPAQRLLELYHGSWAGDLTRIYDEFSF